jgi:acetyl/propionyl-CoA carboxylase alpha subunit
VRYVVDLNGVRSEVVVDGESVTLDGHTAPARVDEIEGTPVRLVTIGSEVHRVVVRRGTTRGAYTLWVDGFRFEGEALDERTRVIRDMTAESQRSTGPASLLAPMPGLIVRVNVAPGESVKAGQGLIVMEAMKMENELRAHAAGMVKTVLVEPGKAVEKGAVLVEFRSAGEGG